MKRLTKFFLCALPLGLAPQALFAQTAPVTPVSNTVPSAKSKVAAVVNGREIAETALERALKPIAKENREKAQALTKSGGPGAFGVGF